MKIIQVDNAQEGGEKVFEIIKSGIKKGAKVLGLPTGSTPKTLYKKIAESDLNFSNICSINLDEYIGLNSQHPQSYHHFMHVRLFYKKPFKKSFIPNGIATNLEKECEYYNKIINDNPIDIQILGIGQNGHIGFNEPGSLVDTNTSIVSLTKSTINANKCYFNKIQEVPKKAISMGIGSILKGKKLILMAYGIKKAKPISSMINGPITSYIPASYLRLHKDVTIIVDKLAAIDL